jgi:hypothetical protein
VKARLKEGAEQPWAAKVAVLQGPKGELLRPFTLWIAKPVTTDEPGGTEEGDIILEWMLPEEDQALGTYTLLLWDTSGRSVTLHNVSFPSLSSE